MSSDRSSKKASFSNTTSPKKHKRNQQPSPPILDNNDDDGDEGQQHEWFHPFTQNDPLYVDYMTNEWGYEKHTDEELFEKLCLEGAQSGLSWRTILHKRQAYRTAFHNFDIDKVATMTNDDVETLLAKESTDTTTLVVRHRGKLESVINNANIIQQLKADGTITSFKDYLWTFVMQSCGFVIDHLVGSRLWVDAEDRLKKREGGYQAR